MLFFYGLKELAHFTCQIEMWYNGLAMLSTYAQHVKHKIRND
ncbi:hypothetical protein STFR1_50022 [Bacillus vallismortis]